MRVSEVGDHVTHAVITPSEVINMGISDNAEFMQMLSATLYSDQILAVVREVICNAWDAHIDAGLTDKPIEIQLTHDKLSIRDFGKGICHEDMGPIYGIYGASTKLKKADNTGGFGLGCKAPFAYTDSFEVVSCHEGTKTIYRVSRSSTAAEGKPAIIPITSFPTTETGLTVSIDIDTHDGMKFKNKIESVLNNGEIPAIINNKEFENKLKFSECNEGFLITTHSDFRSNIMVKYGSVIYPVEPVPELVEQYEKVRLILHKAASALLNDSKIIFLAKPDSISVTPSRESLSMQEYTVETLQGLMGDFINRFNRDFDALCTKNTKDIVDEAFEVNEIDLIISRSHKLPAIFYTDTQNITTLDTFSRVCVEHEYPSSNRKKDLEYRTRELIKRGLVDKGLARTYLKDLRGLIVGPSRPYLHNMNMGKSLWVQKRLIAPLLTKMVGKPLMDQKRLYIREPMRCAYYKDTNDLFSAIRYPSTSADNNIVFLKKKIVICTSKGDLQKRVEQSNEVHISEPFIFYQISRHKGAKEAAVEFFKDRGFNVVDLCPLTNHIPVRDTARSNKTKRVSGLPLVSSLKDSDGKIYTKNYLEKDVKRTREPEFVITILPSRAGYSQNIPGFSKESTKYIVETFGDRGCIARSSVQQQSYIKKGAKTIDRFLADYVMGHFEKNPHMFDLYANSFNNVKEKIHTLKTIGVSNLNYTLPTIFMAKELRELFKIEYNPTKEEKAILNIMEDLRPRFTYQDGKDYTKFKNKLLDIKLPQSIEDLVEEINSNVFIVNTDFSSYYRVFSGSNEEVKKELTECLVKVLSKEEPK